MRNENRTEVCLEQTGMTDVEIKALLWFICLLIHVFNVYSSISKTGNTYVQYEIVPVSRQENAIEAQTTDIRNCMLHKMFKNT
jgi:hypothetical protein